MKKDTFYFSHDYNAHNDIKILYMRQELGMEGYGIYWFLIETLADSGGILPLKILPVLAKQMDSTQVKIEAVIMQYDLFIVQNGKFFSERLLNHIELRNGLSNAGRIGAEKRWKNGGAISHPISDPNAKERKGKEKKGKEIKEINMVFNSENFLNEWNNWKEYKKHQHRFVFKTSDSEQKSLNNLYELSKGNEFDAIKIMNQSIANGWKGFFELKTLNNESTNQDKRTNAIKEYLTRNL